LWDAPFAKPLKILHLGELSEDVRLVLSHLGLDEGETIRKQHVAPLGDPASILIGTQAFSLRAELCRKIRVEEAP
jgi:Fe2+ transport system protein FeoA